MAVLFKTDAQTVVAKRDQNGAYYVFDEPSHYSPPAGLINGRNIWLVDYAVRSGGSIVPQEIWHPRQLRYREIVVDDAPLRTPVFFVNIDGSVGVLLSDGFEERMQLRGGNLAQPLSDNARSRIRIAVCTYSFCACPLP